MRTRWGLFSRSVSWVLAALLLAGFPGAGMLGTASAATGNTGGEITVGSDPVGAAVYVDGRNQGSTPLSVDKLAPGDHRVTVVKDGYLENSRVISVAAGRSQSVQVKLTPDAGAIRRATRMTPQEDEKEKEEHHGGGKGKKIALIGVGVAALGVGGYFAFRKTNKAPTISTTSANPTTGLAGVTTITFTVNASDPDGDALTYTWNFGDGGTGSGASATHVFNSAGTFNASVTVSDSKLTASGNTSVTIKSLSGSWRGNLDTVSHTANLTQSGTSVSGSWSAMGFSGSISGTISAPNTINMTVTIPGFIPFTMRGTIDSSFDRMSGQLYGSGFNGESWNLSR